MFSYFVRVIPFFVGAASRASQKGTAKSRTLHNTVRATIHSVGDASRASQPHSARVASWATLTLAVFALNGCSLLTHKDLQPPTPMQIPQNTGNEESTGQLGNANSNTAKAQPKFSTPPKALKKQPNTTEQAPEQLFPEDGEENLLLNINNLPISAFINEVFGNILKLDFQIDPKVVEKNDLVTLRVSNKRNQAYIYQLAREILNDYGVQMLRNGDNYFKFSLGQSKTTNEPPVLLTGAALPNVPESHRPIIYIRNLETISSSEAYSMLRSIFSSQRELVIEREAQINSLRLQGPSHLVQQANEVLMAIDQPSLRGMHVLRINPLYISAQELAEGLERVVSAQGYDIGKLATKAIQYVSIDKLGALFIFAQNEQQLKLLSEWAAELDQALSASAAGEAGLYWYSVKNTPAQELAQTLNAVFAGSGSLFLQSADDKRLQGKSLEKDNSPSIGNSSNEGGFVVNEARNMLLYKGTPNEWQRILPLIQELDTAPDQVLVEVVVAEVTLADKFSFGMEWALNEISAAGAKGTLGSNFGTGIPGTGLDSGGLLWSSISGSGNTRLALNAFASNSQVNILQTPRILVRSGESASVVVGTEVPIISRQSTGSETVNGSSSINQEIQMRSTGISLRVLPRVFSDGRIDLEITQEVSQAQPNETSKIDSPMIMTRSVDTRLSLQDGSSVLLGGLISNSQSKGDSRMPWLGDIPLLGRLFRVDNTSAERTELMVMVVPYRVRNAEQAQALSEEFKKQLRLLNQDNTKKYPLYKGGIQN